MAKILKVSLGILKDKEEDPECSILGLTVFKPDFSGLAFSLTTSTLNYNHFCVPPSSHTHRRRLFPSFKGKCRNYTMNFHAQWSTGCNTSLDLVFIFPDETKRCFIYTIMVSECYSADSPV
jgi:hypothetical protein